MESSDFLNYHKMLDRALLGVVKDALKQVASDGLCDNHYFYLTFKSNAKGVVIPDFLLHQYPETLTIVIQHEYSNLSVSETGFGVTLSFNNYNCHIIVPFNALIAFSDPSVDFSLTFEPVDEPVELVENEPEFTYKDGDSNIISMSEFMNKHTSPNGDDVA